MRRLLLPLLAAACAAAPVSVDRQPGIDGSWTQGPAQLDITGTTATLSFHGRILVFTPLARVRGQIQEDDVTLVCDRLRLHIDKERLEIEEGKARVTRPLAELPAGSRFTWRDGQLNPG